MPRQSFSREDLDQGVANHPLVVKMQRDMADLQKQNHTLVQENAAIRMERIEAEVTTSLDELEREGYSVVRATDGPELCRMSREDRAKRIEFMKATRAKKDVTPLPGHGNPVIDPNALSQPFKFERADGAGVVGDPALAGGRIPDDDYDKLAAAAGRAAAAGKLGRFNMRDFDVSILTEAAANGVQVR